MPFDMGGRATPAQQYGLLGRTEGLNLALLTGPNGRSSCFPRQLVLAGFFTCTSVPYNTHDRTPQRKTLALNTEDNTGCVVAGECDI